jgi:hypothetical protein
MWAAVEWSPTRKRWCIEDAAGRCLAHVEHQHGEHQDKDAAIALAKDMIRDGRMPSPEDAERTWQERQDQHRAVLEPLEHPETLFEAVDDFLEVCNADFTRSNSFQRLKAELIRHIRAHRQEIEDSLPDLRSCKEEAAEHATRQPPNDWHLKYILEHAEEAARKVADAEHKLARANEMLLRLEGG